MEHWLNGEEVVEYQLWTPEWEALVKAGKWKDFPGYGRARKGRIGLQDHGNKVYFRNIKIRPLAQTPAAKPPGEDWVPLFNGKDFTGWNKVGQEDWAVTTASSSAGPPRRPTATWRRTRTTRTSSCTCASSAWGRATAACTSTRGSSPARWT